MAEDKNEDQAANESIDDKDLESVSGGRSIRGNEPLQPQDPEDRFNRINWVGNISR